MSLQKKRRMTEKRLAMIRRNQKHSRGPTTPEGRERIRATNLRHGFYSKDDQVALRALGEDSADFLKMQAGLLDKKTIGATLQERLAKRLARAFVRMDRADRMQEGYDLRQSKEEDHTREGRLHVQMMRLKMISRNWQLLAQSVARPYYITTPADLKMMQHLHKDGVVKEMSEVALALFYQLREPGTLCPGDPGFEDEEEKAKRRVVMTKIRAIFGLGPLDEEDEDVAVGARHGVPVQEGQQDAESDAAPASRRPMESQQDAGATEADLAPAEPGEDEASPGIVGVASPESPTTDPEAVEVNPYPDVTEEQWEAREPVRQLLENILTRQVEIFDAQHHDLMRQCLSGPSPHERAAEVVPTHPNTPFMQRMEDSNCRQILRLSSLLIRLRRQTSWRISKGPLLLNKLCKTKIVRGFGRCSGEKPCR